MSFYSDLAATASRLLAQRGKSVVLRRVTVGTYDKSTGKTANTTQDVALKGAMFDFREGAEMVAGVAVVAADKKLILEAAGFEPTLKDLIVDGASVYQIVGVRQANPAGTAVAYTLHLRK